MLRPPPPVHPYPAPSMRQPDLTIPRQQMYRQIEDIRSGANASRDASSHSTVFYDILSCKVPKHEEASHRLKDEAHLLPGAGRKLQAGH
jgi:hypothetical protein